MSSVRELEAEEEALLADVHHTERVHEILPPTLLVAGAEEEREIFQQMELMAEKIPHARWHVIPGTAHMPNFESPAEFNFILDDFLEDICY